MIQIISEGHYNPWKRVKCETCGSVIGYAEEEEQK